MNKLAALGVCDRIVDHLVKKYKKDDVKNKVKNAEQEYMDSINKAICARFRYKELNEKLFYRVKPSKPFKFMKNARPQSSRNLYQSMGGLAYLSTIFLTLQNHKRRSETAKISDVARAVWQPGNGI